MNSALIVLVVLIIILLVVGIVVIIIILTSKKTCTPGKTGECEAGSVCYNGSCMNPRDIPCSSTSICPDNLSCRDGKCSFLTSTIPINSSLKTLTTKIKNNIPAPLVIKAPKKEGIHIVPIIEPIRHVNTVSKAPIVNIEQISKKIRDKEASIISVESFEDDTPEQSIKVTKNHSNVQSLYECVKNNYYCSNTVLDVAATPSHVYLLNGTNMIRKMKGNIPEDITLSNNISAITAAGSRLFGINTRGMLYLINSKNGHCILLNTYIAVKGSSDNKIPSNIKHINSTLDGNYLWIQTNDKGYLFTITSSSSLRFHSSHMTSRSIRIYGKTINNYCSFSIEYNSAEVYPTGDKIENIKWISIDEYGSISSISIDRNDYNKLIIGNKNRYYIK